VKRERERERERKCVCVILRERHTESVCRILRERQCVWVSVWLWVWVNMRVWKSVWKREREEEILMSVKIKDVWILNIFEMCFIHFLIFLQISNYFYWENSFEMKERGGGSQTDKMDCKLSDLIATLFSALKICIARRMRAHGSLVYCSQFHQHFTFDFFVQKCFAHLFSMF